MTLPARKIHRVRRLLKGNTLWRLIATRVGVNVEAVRTIARGRTVDDETGTSEDADGATCPGREAG